MFLCFSFFLLISVNFLLFVKALYVPNFKRVKHFYLRSNDSNYDVLRTGLNKIYFISSGMVMKLKIKKERLNSEKENDKSENKFSTNENKNERNKTDETNLTCFDDYFNEESPQKYIQLEAEKLKIIKESIQSNKKEIREIMEKNYKNEYIKLLKEEKEDAQLSNKVYENLKITFHMNQNINNIMFTQYSDMINKLKEQSTILKNFYTIHEKEKKEVEKDSPSVSSVSQQKDNIKEENSDSIKEENSDNIKENSEENEKESISEKKSLVEPVKKNMFENLKKSNNKNILDEITQNVQFFKPENYENIQRTRTFSDRLFTNVKIETSDMGDLYKDKLEMDNEEEEELEDVTEPPLVLQNSVSPLQMLKENVKTCLQYKNENIIKNKLNVDHLHGRVKVHWFPKFMKRTTEKISDFIKMSDIIIEVRNSIIPFVFDDLYSLNFFNFVTNKPKIIVYTRCDVSSEKGNEEWGHYYRRLLFWADKQFNKNISKEHENQMKKSAVIFVDAKNGGKEIIILKKLINKLCKHVIEKKRNKGIANYKIKCIFLGLPNVGKSALINRLLNLKKTKSYDSPGVTKVIQMYSSKKYELIDTPGLLADNLYKIREKEYNKNNRILENIYHFNSNDYSQNNIVHIKNYKDYMHIENNIYLLALCNHISPQSYDIYNIAEVLLQNMYNSYIYNNDYIDLKRMIKRYDINFTECLNNDGLFSAFHFIQKLARDKFQNDINKASMRLVSDFRKNYLGKITLCYPLYFNKKKITLKVSRKFVQQKSDKYVGW